MPAPPIATGSALPGPDLLEALRHLILRQHSRGRRDPAAEAVVVQALSTPLDREEADHWGYVSVVFTPERPLGYLRATRVRVADEDLLLPPCMRAHLSLSERAGRRLRVFHVTMSSLLPDQRREGHGVALYAEAIRAAGPYGCLAAGECFEEGSTSTAAERVWSSRRLAGAVAVEGRMAWGGP